MRLICHLSSHGYPLNKSFSDSLMGKITFITAYPTQNSYMPPQSHEDEGYHTTQKHFNEGTSNPVAGN